MTGAARVVGWGRAVRMHERRALAVLDEVLDYFGRLQRARARTGAHGRRR